MIGAILGDIIGSRFEFSLDRKNKTEDFELFTKNNYITDDSVLTIATADAILNNKYYSDCYDYWGNKYPYAGYGGNFKNWLKDGNKQPYNSYGNGSAMRVSPVGWLFDDLDTVLFEADKSARCTHNHEEGIKGATSVACAIYLARKKTDKKVIKEIIELAFGYDLSRTIEQIRPTYKFEVTCQKSVPESIICFLEGNSYEDVVRKAVSLGGDTDTQACIAGSIAEAYYGIPIELSGQLSCYVEEDMQKIITQYLIRK